MAHPLSHIRVLDLSRVLAGPWAGQYLADLGAEVIKIERPGTGDDTRGWGPPFAVAPTPEDPGLSAYYLCTNRGKRSVALDLASSEGQALVRHLAEKCDVVIENYKVGGLAKYGLDYQSLKAVNAGVVYCSITGFGQTGPYAERAGYDFLVQGMGGLMSVTGEPDEVAGSTLKGGPVKVGVAIADQVTGLNALAAILAALVRRERTGEGDYIDVALLDCTVCSLVNQGSTYLVDGSVPGRMGNAHPTVVPYQAYRTADGHIILAIGNDGQFQRFCKIAGHADLAKDERYRTNALRIINRATLIPEMERTVATRSTADWIAALEAAAVPCGPINTIDQVFADPQVQHRGMRRVLTHPDAGPLAVTANPIHMASCDTTSSKAPPRLGEDTRSVLAEVLGLADAEIDALIEKGTVEAR